MKKLITLLALCLLLTACAKTEPAPEAVAQNEIKIVPDTALTAAVTVPTDAAAPEAPADAVENTAEGAEQLLYASTEVAAIPRQFSELTAAMTQSTDEMGRRVFSDGIRTATPFEWNIEGETAYTCSTDTAAYRFIAQYAPNGKLILITAVPMSSIDPNVCPDAYKVYTELYVYGDRYFGCMRNTEEDGVIVQEMFSPDGTPLFSYMITLDVYGEAERTALHDAAGALVCTATGGQDSDAHAYTDAAGGAIGETEYDALILNVCGDWLNDYYGSVYGA